MSAKPVDVDCMACLVTGVTTPIGWRDPGTGIVHRVRWRVRGGCYRLCDFQSGEGNDEMRKGAIFIDTNTLISVGEP